MTKAVYDGEHDRHTEQDHKNQLKKVEEALNNALTSVRLSDAVKHLRIAEAILESQLIFEKRTIH